NQTPVDFQPEVITNTESHRSSTPLRGGLDFTEAAESTVNGVVSVKSFGKTGGNSQHDYQSDPFFEFFFGPQARPRQKSEPREMQMGLGSGVIVTKDGYIVTNNHVVSGASRLEITLNDNRTFDATLIGTDPATDIALLKIEADDLHVIPWGNSDDLKIGEWVLAVGNPFGFTSTVTAGIVSAKARNISTITKSGNNGSIESFIQTDAAVNPGNSGGALVNLDGELIGINTAIYSQTGNYSGSSFAIPTSIVKKVVSDISDFGMVQRAVLGISFAELTPELAKEKNVTATSSGLYVAGVQPGGSAQAAGIQEGDIIVAIDKAPITNTAQIQEAMALHRPGDKVSVTIIRDNAQKTLEATLLNTDGNQTVSKAGDIKSLGCELETLSSSELSKLNLKYGVRVKSVFDGKFKSAGIKPGFIILDINNMTVNTPDDVKTIYDAIVADKNYDHVMFITGTYPGGKRRVYYAVDLADE
ncbi:MAG: Do family serine endopeptidase, partial [Bacteroidales bacterium]|nr:Do family serine endopeptidase [Bacteroidales bacterium]